MGAAILAASLVAPSLGLEIGSTARAGAQDVEYPKVMREFRGAWVATVANIDWPSKAGLSTEEQQKEIVAMLDRLAELNMNAVVLQVRPHADAMYKSDIEPWSYYLTGKQGQAPNPPYDPLEYWVTESHKRGIQVHAWFNPYRAQHPAQKGEPAENSIVKTRPDLALKLGDKGYYWLDPAAKEVQDLSINVVMDVVRRYDIDGVHFDDYFYPYPDYNDGKDFPDDASWQAYQASGGKLSRGDWRRKAVDDFVERLHGEIKKEKQHVQFGISPFGIARPGRPESIAGFNQYEVLYADAQKWWNEGWLDYLTPQLYWPISQVPQSFPVLLAWWDSENTKERNLWPGLYTSRVGEGEKDWKSNEVTNQIMITRAIVNDGPGHVHFSAKAITLDYADLGEHLQKLYANPALTPRSPWLDDNAPEAPSVSVEKGAENLTVSWEPKGSEKAFQWVVYVQRGRSWKTHVLPAGTTTLDIPVSATKTETTTTGQGLQTQQRQVAGDPVTHIAVSAVDRLGNESNKAVAKLP